MTGEVLQELSKERLGSITCFEFLHLCKMVLEARLIKASWKTTVGGELTAYTATVSKQPGTLSAC